MNRWDEWIGRSVTATDRLGAGIAARWLATFDRHRPSADAFPQGIHWCLCTPEAATSSLGNDGHPDRDGSSDSFLPPVPLPRRMWASSKVDFIAPIELDAGIRRTSRVAGIAEKSGGSGTLVFVDVEHETAANGELAVREVQTLVYRGAAPADAELTPPKTGEPAFDVGDWDAVRTLTPDPRLLFRYSALTFNTHRIHYDLPYARDVERYRGLVVHGPLTASLLLQLAAAEFGDHALASFNFRGVSPAVAGEPLHLALRRDGSAVEFGAFADDGRQIMKAGAVLTT